MLQLDGPAMRHMRSAVNVEYQQANATRLNKMDEYRRKKIIERSQEQQAMQDKLANMAAEFRRRRQDNVAGYVHIASDLFVCISLVLRI